MLSDLECNKKLERLAFTLAEVLITLGIIGVVAALTIPTIIKNVGLKETVSKLKETHAVLTSAFNMAVKDNGDPNSWGLSDIFDSTGSLNVLNNFAPYLKIAKNCGTNNGCFKDVTVTAYNGNDWDNIYSSNYFSKLKLINGVNVAFLSINSTCSTTVMCADIFVDINGEKDPNVLGKDTFLLEMYTNRLVPAGIEGTTTPNNFADACNPSGSYYYMGSGCAAWVIYNENEDYLKSCGSSLAWAGPTSCN